VSADRLRRRAALVAALPLLLGACTQEEWLTDMKQQPTVGPWQLATFDTATAEKTPSRGNPAGSVPVTGVALTSWQQELPLE